MILGELYLYTDDQESKLNPEFKKPSNGDVCLYYGSDPYTTWHYYAILRKTNHDVWKVIFKFEADLESDFQEIKIGHISEQKTFHLLAGYTLRELTFKKPDSFLVH